MRSCVPVSLLALVGLLGGCGSNDNAPAVGAGGRAGTGAAGAMGGGGGLRGIGPDAGTAPGGDGTCDAILTCFCGHPQPTAGESESCRAQRMVVEMYRQKGGDGACRIYVDNAFGGSLPAGCGGS